VSSRRPPKRDRREEARARIAAQRQAQLKAERRRRILLVSSAPVGVIAVVVAIVLIAMNTGGGSQTSTFGPAPSTVVSKVTGVSAADLDTVGVGTTQTTETKKLTGAALTSGALPRVLYVGAEYCPYCAFERWGLAVALSRFGTLSGVQLMKSSAKDVNPSTNTFSFRDLKYTSDYIVFDAHEIQDRNSKSIGTLDAADDSLFTNVGGSSYPFIDVGGKWYQSTSGTTDALNSLQGKTWQQIADALATPTSAVAKAVLGTANQLTAQICSATGDKPTAVCSAAGVQAATKALSSVS
jgi:Domain of unknown function (DUF929)